MLSQTRNWKRIFTEYWQFYPVVVSAFILGSPFLFTGKVLFWGTTILQFVPWRHYAWTAIRSGHLPLWNPLVGMGAPLLANYQSALLYPPNWLLFILDSIGGVTWLAWGQGLLVVLHWCLAGVGMVCLLRWLGISKLGQALGGVGFGLSSYLVGRASFLSINAAVAWLPWVILYCSIVIKDINQLGKPAKKTLIILSIILSMQLLAGHAQTTWYTIVLAFIWSGFWGCIMNNPQNSHYGIKNCILNIIKVWTWICVPLIVAILVSAAQLIPTFEYLLQSQRSSAVDADLAMTYSFWPWRFITLFAPGMFGSPATGDYWGYGNYWEDAIYIGLLPILMGLWILMRGKKVINHSSDRVTRQSFIVLLGAIILGSMIFALGKHTPLFVWLYNNFPTFSMFQAPTRLSLWAIFSITLLAGIGIENTRRPLKRALYWTRLSTAGAFAITLGASMVWGLFKDVAPTFIRASALLGFFGMICGAIVLTAPKIEKSEKQDTSTFRKIWNTVVLVFVSADLIFSNWGLNPGIDRSVINRMTHPVNNLAWNQRLYIPADVEYTLKFDDFMRFDTFSPSIGWEALDSVQIPNSSLLSNTPSVNNFDPLLPAIYSQWMDRLTIEMESGNSEIYHNMLNLMGVGIVEEISSSSKALVEFIQINNPRRVRMVNCAIPAKNNEQAMSLVQENQVNIDEEVIIEGLMIGQEKECLGSREDEINSQIEIVSENLNHLVLQTQSETPGWVVVSDVWYPGWVARIDGERVPIYRANSLFRSVKVEAGNHMIEYSYRPFSFYFGCTLSLFGILLLVLSTVIPWKKQAIK